MLKNKFKMVALLTIFILALTLPIVRAENETTNNVATPDVTTSETASNEAINPISDNPEVNTTSEDNLKKGDVYLTGDNVTVDYIVDGNLFIFANTVTINSQIGGDAFICANSVNVGEQGYIFSNLFTFAKNVTIDGVVYDLYAGAENTTINGYVYRDIHIGADCVNILGTIGRNAYIDCSSLNFVANSNETSNNQEETTPTTKAMISGNLNYSAKTEASIPEGTVTGETSFEQQKVKTNDTNNIQEKIMSLVSFVVTIVAIWLLCLWLAPKFLKNNTSLLTTKKVLPVIGFGLLTPIVAIFLAIMFFILEITATLGLLLILAFIAFIAISTSIFAITLNTIICHKLKIEKTMATFGMLVATSIVLWLIGLIPLFGSILGIIVVFLGMGMIISSLVLKDKKEIVKE